ARRRRSSDLSADEAANAVKQFRSEFASTHRVIEITPALILRAMDLAETRVLRGYDAMQLAAALEVNSACFSLGMGGLTFVSVDGDLNAAAAAEGLAVDNPNTH